METKQHITEKKSWSTHKLRKKFKRFYKFKE